MPLICRLDLAGIKLILKQKSIVITYKSIIMQQVPNQKQKYQNINEQRLPNKTFFYTFTKKQRALTGSIYPKDIILIFCPEDNSLFYVNSDQKLPFADEKNLNKTQMKDIAEVTRSTIQNPPGTIQLVIKYPKKDDKGKESTLEWKFDMANKNVAQIWAETLNNYKAKKEKATRNSTIRPTNNNATSTIKPANSFGVQVQTNEAEKQNHIDLLLTDSKILLNKPDDFTSGVVRSYLNPSVKPEGNQASEIKVTPPPVNTSSNVNPNPIANSNLGRSASNNNISSSNINMQPENIMRNLPSFNSNYNSKPMAEDESRLFQAYEMSSRIIGLNESRVKPQNQSSLSSDWNFRFVKEPTRETVLEFEKAALKAFDTVYNKSKDRREELIEAEVSGMYVQIAQNFTRESKRLKKQYRNYHYILESCKLQTILSVPLSCLIEHLGYVCLVKALFPKQTPVLKNKREAEQTILQLQQRTKISNSILFNNECQFLDLTKIYGSYGQAPRIYVDNLFQYLPEFNFKKKEQQLEEDNTFYVRPQLLSYLGNKVVSGGSMEDQRNYKYKSQFTTALESQILDIADCLSSQDIYITNIFDLKEFLHYRGVNMKFLFKIYQQTKNKFVKKYLQTCIVAKLIKDEINYGLSVVIEQSKDIRPQEFVQEQLRLFMEGKTAATNQSWKKLTIQYRNLYGAPINTHELIGGFLLSCLMTLISAQYDLSLLNKQKIIFKDQGIIQRGFLIRLKPKVKSYYRFSSKIVETVQICKYSEENQEVFKKLVEYMNLNSKTIPESYNVNNSRPYILGYLSDFVPPDSMGQSTLPCTKQIYSLVNQEPPSTPTLKITLNFIKQWLKYLKTQKNKSDQKFQELLRDTIDTINYWLELQHPKICEFYEKVAFYEEMCGDTEESLKILEKALQIAYKTQAKNNSKIGIRHYVVGNQYLKAGRKRQAIDNLQKAKICMEKSQNQESQYALVLLKLASLQLNSGDTDTCIKLGKQALKNAQKGKMNDTYIIKICQILCRAYEIKGQKDQLRKLGAQCARDFNRTQERSAFSQMVKICLTGTIAKLTIDRSKSLLTLAYKIKDQYGIKNENQSINKLMEKTKTSVVMENFMIKSELVEKYLSELTNKKPQTTESSQYMNILGLVAGCVGIDFIEGLHAQKEFQ